MTMRSRLRAAAPAAALLLSLVLGLAACGDPPAEQPSDGESGAMLPPGEQPTATALDVTIDNGETQTIFRVVCDDAPRFEGDAGKRDAKAACDAVAAAKDRLLTLSDPDREPEMCTEIYGGPDKAIITGTVDGAAVEAEVARHNGCGISDWDRLEPLLGAPTGSLE
jgi:hypothetical protein